MGIVVLLVMSGTAVFLATKSTQKLTALSREHRRLVEKTGDFQGKRSDTLWVAPYRSGSGSELSWHVHNPKSCSLICELEILGKPHYFTLDWFSGSVKTLKLSTFTTPRNLGLGFGNGTAWSQTTSELNHFFETHFSDLDYAGTVQEFVEIDPTQAVITLMEANVPAKLESEYRAILASGVENPRGKVFARIRLGTLDSFASDSGAANDE